jgi:hypothetical protein
MDNFNTNNMVNMSNLNCIDSFLKQLEKLANSFKVYRMEHVNAPETGRAKRKGDKYNMMDRKLKKKIIDFVLNYY